MYIIVRTRDSKNSKTSLISPLNGMCPQQIKTKHAPIRTN